MSRKGENIYKRKDGRWEGRYKIGVAENGRARYHSCYGKTYREVNLLCSLDLSPVENQTNICALIQLTRIYEIRYN